MRTKQRTIKKSVSCTGRGLHTGVECKITFKPAEENYGIRFLRLDIDGCPEIRADIEHVVDISRGTTIQQNGARVHTVEHVLAAVTGLGIDNVLIELTEKEPPVMDGSSEPFVVALQKAGFDEQDARREMLVIDRVIAYSDPEAGVDIHVLPSDRFRLTFMIDYKLKSLGTQYIAQYNIEETFASEIAPARTFCFLSEIEALRERGLVKGGDLDNAVVIIDKEVDSAELNKLKSLFSIKRKISRGSNGILNGKKLRYDNEPVRHKMLDLIGDLALLGIPIRGHVIAARSGHKSNVELVKLIKKEYEKKMMLDAFSDNINSDFVLDIKSILKLLPHRYPFVLIDRIIDIQQGSKVTAVKNVTYNEPFFQGHFPDQPILPGVLILEAMAQAGAFLALNSVRNPLEKNMFFSAINSSKFRQPVIPGDQLRIEVELLKIRMGAVKLSGKAYVKDKLVSEAVLMANIVERAKKNRT